MARKCKNCKATITHQYLDPYCNNNCYKEHKKIKTKEKSLKTQLAPTPESLQSLIKKLDEVFSRLVRLTGAKRVNTGETKVLVNRCYTCGKMVRVIHPMIEHKIQAGHWIQRRYFLFRYSEFNVKPQCHECNSKHIGNGMQNKFKENLENEYGREYIEDQMKKFISGRAWQYSYGRYISSIETISEKVKELKKRLEIV